MEEETTNKREPWPTGLFACCSGGISLCLWAFLCPTCLLLQTQNYSHDLEDSSSKRPLTESQFERYPHWSCRGFVCSHLASLLFFGYCCCFYGFIVGCQRHEKYSPRINMKYYCSSQPCCCCRNDFLIEDCLIGYFCCCCSLIQVTMANAEHFRMQSKVEGDLNIKRAH